MPFPFLSIVFSAAFILILALLHFIIVGPLHAALNVS